MIKPSFSVKVKDENQYSATFLIEPLEQGYGHTLGNALRRVMLDSLEGAAITEVKIKGVRHQFSTLKGMNEDVVEFILNLKNIRISYEVKESETLHLSAQGPGEVKASQIKTPATAKIVNKDLVLATLANKKSTLEAEITIARGSGYSPAEDRKSDRVGVIPVDATFTPVKRIAYRIESTRVGRKTDLDRLIMEVTTDGTVKPKEALEQAAKILQAYFKQVYKPEIVKEVKDETEFEMEDETFKLTVEELDLPTRIANALRKGGCKTVKDLVNTTEGDLAQVKNLGEKSVGLIKKALKKKEVALKE